MRFLKKTILSKEVRAILCSARLDLTCHSTSGNDFRVFMKFSLLLGRRCIVLWHEAIGAVVAQQWQVQKYFSL